jgi:hypothetical protein
MFDRADVKEARKKLGGWAWLGGNVPGALADYETAPGVSTGLGGIDFTSHVLKAKGRTWGRFSSWATFLGPQRWCAR